MKNEEIEILEKVLGLLEHSASNSDSKLIMQYKSLCEKFRAKNEKEKQNYRDNQDYHRSYTRTWAKEHPEQAKKHQDEYLARKRQRKIQREER